MKQKVLYTAVLILLLTLCGCSAQEAPTPETEIVQTEAMTVPTEPTPPETEAKHNIELYELDTSEYDFTFEKVLLKIDWTDMTFALKCFDGSVVTGTVEKDGHYIICTYDGGQVILQQGVRNGKAGLHQTNYIYETGLYFLTDQLMFCPQTDAYMDYSFLRAEDQKQEITVGPEREPLDSYKHLYKETFRFYTPAIGKDGQQDQPGYHFFIQHYPLAEKWEFQLYTKPHTRSVEVEATENPDGSILFSLDGKEWNFHRKGDNLCFDGGSSLIVGNWMDVTGQNYFEMELPEGSVLNRTVNNSYVYDALYVLPGSTLEECYTAIQLDTKNQWVKIQCWDGQVLRGPFTYGDEYCNYIVFNCEVPDFRGMGTRTVQIDLRPNGHALCISNPWMMSICPDGLSETNSFYLFPVQGVIPQGIPE